MMVRPGDSRAERDRALIAWSYGRGRGQRGGWEMWLLWVACAVVLVGAVAGEVVGTPYGNVIVTDLGYDGTDAEDLPPGLDGETGLDGIAPQTIGGDVVKHIREFPFLIALIRVDNKQKTRSIFCSGFVIDNKIVASAAHCAERIIKGRKYTFYACGGTTNVYKNKNRVCKRIRRTLIPEKYSDRLFFFGYDFMILTLAKSIIKGGVKPVKLNFLKPRSGTKGYAVGFGKYDRDLLPDGQMRAIRNRIVLNTGKCKTLNLMGLQKRTNLICGDGSPRRTCNGDSGSPLLFRAKRPGKRYAVGVLSFGAGGCPRNYESAYTSLHDLEQGKLMRFMITQQANGSFKEWDKKKRIKKQKKMQRRLKDREAEKEANQDEKPPKGSPGFRPRQYSYSLCIDMSEGKCTALRKAGQCLDPTVAMNCPKTCNICDASDVITDLMPVIPPF